MLDSKIQSNTEEKKRRWGPYKFQDFFFPGGWFSLMESSQRVFRCGTSWNHSVQLD